MPSPFEALRGLWPAVRAAGRGVARRPDEPAPHTGALEDMHDVQWTLRESEARLRDLVETQTDIVFRRDDEGRLTWVNPAFCRHFAATPAAALGRPFEPRLVAGSLPRTLPADQRHQRFLIGIDTDDGPRWLAFDEHRVPDRPGRPSETQCVGRDVTDQRRHEAELRAARHQAEAANRAKSRFLATMSHEIRTPMNGILGMTALLRDTPASAEQQTYIGAVEHSARTLLALIDEILDFSKIEAGRVDLEDTTFSIEECAQSVVELLYPRAREKGIDLAWAIDPALPALATGDEARLRQILVNLVGNAVKFTDSGGVLVTVTRDVSKPAHEPLALTVSVRDSGPGISPEAFRSLFTEFERGDEAQRRHHGGTGLGLAIARGLARAMGGDIMARSTPGEGSEFTAVVRLRAHGLPRRNRTSQPHHALLALPDGQERMALRLILEGAEIPVAECVLPEAGAVVDAAQAEDMPITVVVLDGAHAPDEAAALITACRRATVSHRGRLTALAILDHAPRDGFESHRAIGFDGFLVRPVRAATLLQRLEQRAGDEPAPVRAPVLRRVARTAREPAMVLLVEDNDINALLARRMLEKCGCTVEQASNGLRATEAVQRHLNGEGPVIDLVLMDVHMPVLDGLEAARRIRECASDPLAVRARPPIVALTANAFEEDRKRCLEAGMDDYLAKPFERDELESLLHKWSAGRAFDGPATESR